MDAPAPKKIPASRDISRIAPEKRGKRTSTTAPNTTFRPLTERQRAYVAAVGRDGLPHNAAARQAGFSTARGGGGERLSYLKKDPKIIHAIAIEKEKWEKASAMTKKRVVEGFLEAIDMARVKADPIVMVAGWREIAKLCGYYEPTKHKLEVSVNGQVVLEKLQTLDDNQLLALADGDASALEGEFSVVDPSETPEG